jgi:hypothetical protein
MTTARHAMAVLYERRIIGEDPRWPDRYASALRQAHHNLDALARLATHPDTAPAVFAWLVEVGVLAVPDEPCDCTAVPRPFDRLEGLEAHYHAAMDHERASGEVVA